MLTRIPTRGTNSLPEEAEAPEAERDLTEIIAIADSPPEISADVEVTRNDCDCSFCQEERRKQRKEVRKQREEERKRMENNRTEAEKNRAEGFEAGLRELNPNTHLARITRELRQIARDLKDKCGLPTDVVCKILEYDPRRAGDDAASDANTRLGVTRPTSTTSDTNATGHTPLLRHPDLIWISRAQLDNTQSTSVEVTASYNLHDGDPITEQFYNNYHNLDTVGSPHVAMTPRRRNEAGDLVSLRDQWNAGVQFRSRTFPDEEELFIGFSPEGEQLYRLERPSGDMGWHDRTKKARWLAQGWNQYGYKAYSCNCPEAGVYRLFLDGKDGEDGPTSYPGF
jgi:hypothetical protein